MQKFTLGAIAGVGSVLIAVPILAQFASAASSTGSATTKTAVLPTQACVQALATAEQAKISGLDAMIAARKTILQAHADALTKAAAITDDTARAAAIKQANTDMRTALKAAMPTPDQAAIDALKAACGNTFGHGGFAMGMGMGAGMEMGRGGMRGAGAPNSAALATKLGITQDQLTTELNAGKTIQQIATEHGVTLPTPPAGGMRRHGMGMWGAKNGTTNTTTAPATTQQ